MPGDPKRAPAVKRPVRVEVRSVVDPDGEPGVLLQLEDGWVVVPPAGALQIAADLAKTAAEVQGR